eukprot:PhF_6_TR40588/c0_g1_i1/m.60871
MSNDLEFLLREKMLENVELLEYIDELEDRIESMQSDMKLKDAKIQQLGDEVSYHQAQLQIQQQQRHSLHSPSQVDTEAATTTTSRHGTPSSKLIMDDVDEEETDENGNPYIPNVEVLARKYKAMKQSLQEERARRVKAVEVCNRLRKEVVAQIHMHNNNNNNNATTSNRGLQHPLGGTPKQNKPKRPTTVVSVNL